LIVSWEEGEDLAVIFLRMMMDGRAAPRYSPGTAALIAFFFARQPSNFERFDRLLDVIREKIDTSKSRGTGSFRGIIFVQQRVTAHIVQHFITTSSGISDLLRPVILYSASSPATPSLRVTPSQAAAALKSFGSGEHNVLISTSVAEEGVDVPEANCVIYFDPIQTSVSYVQGRGRARQTDSSFVMMQERPDRPASFLAQMELEQNTIASSFQPQQGKVQEEAEVSTQHIGESGAFSVLPSETSLTAFNDLNLYCKQTNATFWESYYHPSQSSREWHCTLRYDSVLRSVTVQRCAEGKKQARAEAALALLNQLEEAAC
jgi:superfamily II DNA helicase RecQ